MLEIIFYVILAVSALFWAFLFYINYRNLLSLRVLRPLSAVPKEEPFVSVIVPVRNE
jgi:cellulose synthase/poly-beta-1,6-N-acetylglucosamine synthase-like glycosyltransferase